LHNKRGYPIIDFEEDRQVFAAVFQYSTSAWRSSSGVLGIFMKSVPRRRCWTKTLHFWFLAPARRETLLAGKYLAGLIAAVVIFTAGAALCFGAMLWPQDPAQFRGLLAHAGSLAPFLVWGIGCAGCVGYGASSWPLGCFCAIR